jgi:L-alanine-DL-glutamate epimerase-like enolase superfamily enzyme
MGGITPARGVVDLALQNSLELSFHIYPETSIHLAMASGGIVETFERGVPGGNPLDPSDRMIVGGPTFSGGMATAPTADGLGYDLDWELLTRSGEG